MGQDEESGGSFEVTADLSEEFGRDRVRDTPTNEAAYVGTVVTGICPVKNISFADFICVYFDLIMNQVGNTQYMFGDTSEAR
ncbi:hypothetical protein [Halegenticoccus soli]|uniref:hypothetical protein n=1 Tax=Halegenticoccus soli TaxID=1985678 RepID=UPI001E5C72F6